MPETTDKHPGGRPTKYTPELLERAKHYLEDWQSLEDAIPSIEALSEYINISTTCIYDWAKQEDKKEFADTLARLNALQKRILINKGLLNEFNSNITKLALGNHGMSEKQQQEISGPGGGPQEHNHTGDVTFVGVPKD